MAGNAGFDYSSNNRRWQKLRLRILRRDGYLCQESRRYGKLVEATTVHHVWPAEDYPEFAYSEWNLLSLCEEAHEKMHDRKTRKLSPLGERWRKKKTPPSFSHDE